MLCTKYIELTPPEKTAFIGELLHSVQSDDQLFEMAKEIIIIAIRKGLFNGVVINPPKEKYADDKIL